MFKPRFANKNNLRLLIPAVSATALTGGYLYYRSPANNTSTGGQAPRSRKQRDEEALSGAGVGQTAITGGHETGQVGSGVQPATGDVERTVETTASSRDELPSGGVGGGVGAGGANVRAIEMTGRKGYKDNLADNVSQLSSSIPGVGNSESSIATSEDSKPSGSSDNTGNMGSTSKTTQTASRGSSEDFDMDPQSVNHKVTSSSYPTSSSDHNPSGKPASSQDTSISQRLQGAFSQGGKASGEPGEAQRRYSDTRIHSNATDVPTKRHSMRSDS